AREAAVPRNAQTLLLWGGRLLRELNLGVARVGDQGVDVKTTPGIAQRASARGPLIQVAGAPQPQSHTAPRRPPEGGGPPQFALHGEVPLIRRGRLPHRVLRLDELGGDSVRGRAQIKLSPPRGVALLI